jgi:hypothetical protein
MGIESGRTDYILALPYYMKLTNSTALSPRLSTGKLSMQNHIGLGSDNVIHLFSRICVSFPNTRKRHNWRGRGRGRGRGRWYFASGKPFAAIRADIFVELWLNLTAVARSFPSFSVFFNHSLGPLSLFQLSAQ